MSLIRRRPNTITALVDDQSTSYAPESVDIDIAISTFMRHCRVKNVTDDTVRYYTVALSSLKRFLADEGVSKPIDIDKDVIDAIIIAKQETGVKETSTNSTLRAWRSFLNFLHHDGYITNDVGSRIKLIKAEKRVIQTFTKDQMRSLLGTPNKSTFTGYRDYVLMLTLLDTGVRISEAEGIRLPDVNWSDRTIKVFGKGRKERVVPFQSTLDKHLKEYVSIRGPLEHDFLYVNIDNSPMKKRTMQENIANYGRDANIKDVRVSPHTFRHTFARLYITNGGDIFSLQKILGHSSLDIVKTYVNLFGTDVAKMHRMYSPLDRLNED